MFGPAWAVARAEWLRDAWTGPGIRPGLLAITVAALVVSIISWRASAGSRAVHLLLGTLAAFAANALVPHLAVVVWLGRYNPGAATAVVLVLPAAAWVYAASLRDRSATPAGAVVAALAGTAVYALFLAAVRGAEAGERRSGLAAPSSAESVQAHGISISRGSRTVTRGVRRCRRSCGLLGTSRAAHLRLAEPSVRS